MYRSNRGMGTGGHHSCVEHGLHRQHRRERGPAGITGEFWSHCCRCAVGRRVLRADAGRVDSGGRVDGRFVWPPTDVSAGCCGIRYRVAALRRRLQHPSTDFCASHSGNRSCVSRSRQSGVDQRIVRGERPRPGDRHLVWLDSDHHRDWSGLRRLADSALVLALGLLRQFAVSGCGDCHLVMARSGEPQQPAKANRLVGRAGGHPLPKWAGVRVD